MLYFLCCTAVFLVTAQRSRRETAYVVFVALEACTHEFENWRWAVRVTLHRIYCSNDRGQHRSVLARMLIRQIQSLLFVAEIDELWMIEWFSGAEVYRVINRLLCYKALYVGKCKYSLIQKIDFYIEYKICMHILWIFTIYKFQFGNVYLK